MQIANGSKTIILMPIYDDAASSEILFAALKEELKEGFFVVAVDDGSVVSPPDLRSMEKRVSRARSFGSPAIWVIKAPSHTV